MDGEKMKNTKKITSILIISSVSMLLFVGCGSTKTDTTSAKADTTTSATTSNNKRFDAAEMKTIYSDILKTLVTDKTITQTQSDQVLEVVSKTMPTGGGRPNGTPPADGSSPTGEGQVDGMNPNDAPPTDRTMPNGAKQNNRLSELVTSKVITQTQADTINQKFQEAMKSTRNANAQ
jgi:hypothetical protein